MLKNGDEQLAVGFLQTLDPTVYSPTVLISKDKIKLQSRTSQKHSPHKGQMPLPVYIATAVYPLG